MAGVEAKGLAAGVKRARETIAATRLALQQLDADTRALEKTLTSVNKQINDLHDGLKAEAESLGNPTPAATGPMLTAAEAQQAVHESVREAVHTMPSLTMPSPEQSMFVRLATDHGNVRRE